MMTEPEPVLSSSQIEITRLISELKDLNGQDYQQMGDKVYQVYNRLYELHLLENKEIVEVRSAPDVNEVDLISLCQGVYQTFKYYPRPIQLMAVILLFNHEQNQGRLAQIYTGEGKTIIVAMLAVLLVKKKLTTVDIITSSPVLAKRDAEELVNFYSQFKVTVSHNIEKDPIFRKGQLPCYNSQIVYGNTHSFEADILRHEYSELGTRGDRKLEYAIVDEVDSMLIDGINYSTYLSSPIPGMLDITKILRLIWDEICKVEGNITQKNNVLIYYNNEMYEVELEEYITMTLDIQIREAIGELMLPYRLDYINFMKETWIKNAICVKYLLQLNQNYIIDKGKVRIVDYENTGVIHDYNMQWQDGLHQFVQLKHKLSVSSLQITTNFMSNACFFKRYGSKIVGLTGTLGSIYTREFLARQYNVDFVLIPHYKKRFFFEQPGATLASTQDWLEEIFKDVIYQIKLNRAVLIINQSIRDVKSIEQKLMSLDIKITLYTDDSQYFAKKIGEKEVIIATNLAGRGTDLITNDELEFNGGLHVIVTFLPRNIRIQEQAFGRTARQGKKGTARLIIQSSKSFLVSKDQQTLSQLELIQQYIQGSKNQKQGKFDLMDVVKYYRDINEEIQMNEMGKEMQKLINEDLCFQEFCKIAKSMVSKKDQPALFQSLEEKWGLYFQQHKQTDLNQQDIKQFLNNDSIINPRYNILQSLQEDSEVILMKEPEIANLEPAFLYYKGCFCLRKLQPQNFQRGLEILWQAKQLFQQKIDNEWGCNLAFAINEKQITEVQLVNEQDDLIMQNNEAQQKQNFNLADYEKKEDFKSLFEEVIKPNQIQQKLMKLEIDSKTKNQIGVYQKFIQNIDELTKIVNNFDQKKEELEFAWTSTIENESYLKKIINNQDHEDIKEVVNDGPLPLMGKLYKRNKEHQKFSWFAMFLIGIIQFVAGCFICACSAGAAVGIGKKLIKEGISDMVLAITSKFKGVAIDWGGWGQNKIASFCAILALSGPAAIKEAFSVVDKKFKTLIKVGISALENCKGSNFHRLRQVGKWLTSDEKDNLQKQYDTIKNIANQSDKLSNKQQILQMTQRMLNQQVKDRQLQQPTAKEIENLVDQALLKSQETGICLKIILNQLCGKFLYSQMAKQKSSSENDQNTKKNIYEVWQKTGNKISETFQQQISLYNQKQDLIKMQLTNFPKLVLQFIDQDAEVQKFLLALDLIYQNYKLFEGLPKATAVELSGYFSLVLKENPASIESLELENLDLDSEQSVVEFYCKHVKPRIIQFASKMGQRKLFEPLALLLFEKFDQIMKQNQQDAKRLQQNLNKNQIDLEVETIDHTKYVNIDKCVQYVDDLRRKGLIQQNGIAFLDSINSEFEQLIEVELLPKIIELRLKKAFQNAITESQTIKQKVKKSISLHFISVVQINLIQQLEYDIFNQKMKVLDEQIEQGVKIPID